MRKLFGLFLPAAGLAAVIGCSVPAHADQPMGPQPSAGSRIAIGIAPAKVRAPYDVQVIRANGETLPTYAHRDRFYVQGNDGERYVIRVTNPTANRVEAVVTVDGLDVIDGESGDLRKRGYVVPPYGEVRIEGFRTSHRDVASFRFSSVDDSYAGQKGKARNVGVIAVAIFEEHREAPPQIIVESAPPPRPRPHHHRRPYGGGGGDLDDRAAEASGAPAKGVARTEAKRAPAPYDGAPAGGSLRPATPSAPPPMPAAEVTADSSAGAPARGRYDRDYEVEAAPQRSHRPGLGTEFGEQRHSAASFTRFVRGAGRPVAIAELRYNDAAGLIALGIHARPLPDANEIMTRETADPFPGDGRFARPPGR